nr:Brp/Blh family beta-carotene 15,15'-dioxygenase [Halolamina pelagica]
MLYLVVGGAYAVCWLLVPRLAALAFIVLTWFHWGQGDVWVLRSLLDAEHLHARAVRWGTLLVRGGLPMLVPLLFAPDRYRTVLSAWVALFGVRLEMPWLFTPRTRATLGVGFAVLSLGTLALGRLAAGASGRRRWRIDAAEVGLLWAYFAIVPRWWPSGSTSPAGTRSGTSPDCCC